MAKPFTLYWSSLALFEGCPQQFLWSKGWGTIDLGRGPGRGKQRPVKKSEHHAVLGTVIQYVIERFYNDELWRTLPPQQLRDTLLDIAEQSLKLEIARRFVDWRLAPPMEELRQIIRDGVMGYMRTLKAHMLLGPYARAEVEMLGYVDQDTPIGGRADMIIRRDDTGVTILDGKNSKRYKDGKNGYATYTDPDQLRWYALLYYMDKQVLPDRLAFVYFRYPAGMPILDEEGQPTGETETGVTWVPCTLEDVKGLAQRAVKARQAMEKELFEATPHWKQCKFCDFETICQQRQDQKESNRRPSKDPLKGKLDPKLFESDLFTFGGPITDSAE